MIEFLKRLIKKEDDGFTLVEVVVAMGVFAIALLSIIQVFYYSVSLNIRAKQLTTSANLARKEMDAVRLMSIDELDNFKAQVDSLPGGMRKLDINGDGQNEYELIMTVTKNPLAHGTNFFRYVIQITVQPIGMQSGVYIGPPSSYNLRAVLLRNSDDQNKE